MDICVGCSSKVHDARIFALSPISNDLPNLCGGKYHILGDAAYPLREYLLTPYRDYGNITSSRRKYNLMHAQTRVRIENSFGLLKQRFRQLTRLDFFEVEKMSKFVVACCVLHNICIDADDLFDEFADTPETMITPQVLNNREASRNSALMKLGEIKRNNIAKRL